MKKLLILLLIVCMLTVNADAQKGWSIGDQAAIGHSWAVGNRPNNTDRKFHPTFSLGRNAEYHFNNNISLGFGTHFSSEGSTYKDKTSNANLISRLNYIRIPVFASFYFGDARSRVVPSLTIGPTVGFLVGGKTFILTDGDTFIGAKSVKAMDTKIDAGANASLGFTVRVKNGFWLKHNINYYHGMVTQTPNAAISYNDAEYTNRNLSLSLGFLINTDIIKKGKHKMHR
ncbi:MAG: outer membrane beta-barrel protein [Niabella sp.]